MRKIFWLSLSLLLVQLKSLSAQSDLFPVEVNEKVGYIDASGAIIIEPTFDEAFRFSNGLARVEINGQCGWINTKGELKIKAAYGTGSGDFNEGLIPFQTTKKKPKYGYADSTGKVLIKPKLLAAHSFSEGLAIANKKGKWGVLNPEGKWVIEPRYDSLLDFHEGMAAVWMEEKWGFINTEGKLVIQPKYRMVGEFSEGICAAAEKKEFGFIDKRGAWILQPAYRNPASQPPVFREGRAVAVGEKDLWGIIDQSGEWIVTERFQDARDFTEGICAAKSTGEWGWVNVRGKVAVNFATYDEVEPFYKGLAKVKIKGSWNYYINRNSEFVWKGE